MKKLLIASVIPVVLLMVGCGEETKSVEWWKSHPEEAMKKADECKKSGSDTDNCKNVKSALFRNQQRDASVPTFN